MATELCVCGGIYQFAALDNLAALGFTLTGYPSVTKRQQVVNVDNNVVVVVYAFVVMH